ncbi:substrate-binding domain-containing protein [Shinella sp. PSBB067]|uniref:substrate-binding domain-containing protein n=1 Tax=Shinella sp. PSBB067 TaxID=2715959 RepID=UPI00193B6D6E|nr:substrate-binding domain-containing protein [Shinella sp. PSBB067]QRI62381.1 substrate-binding domain-containing protein [Shinella sp. PSBB067]
MRGTALTSMVAVGLAMAPGAFAADVSPKKVGSVDELQDMKDFCGTKPIRVALSDGNGGNSWRRITLAELRDEASKCPNITEVKYTDGQGNPQKQIADIQGLAAQKYDVIVVNPDSGEALIRTMRQATKAGSAVVPFTVGETFAGEPGKDYLAAVTESVVNGGKLNAEWVAKQLSGKGNVIVFGGSPGNNFTNTLKAAWTEVWAKYPGIKVLEGPIDTNWDPAQYQQIMAGLLAKYPQIDAVYSDYGTGSVGALRAFVAAGRKIPVWSSGDANELGCFWKDHVADNPDFKLATWSSRTWLSRLALRKGVAAAEGIDNAEPSILNLPMEEDSTDPALQPKCDASLPPDAILSSKLSKEQLAELFK